MCIWSLRLSSAAAVLRRVVHSTGPVFLTRPVRRPNPWINLELSEESYHCSAVPYGIFLQWYPPPAAVVTRRFAQSLFSLRSQPLKLTLVHADIKRLTSSSRHLSWPMGKHDAIHKTWSTYNYAVLKGGLKIWWSLQTYGFWDMLAERQTYRRTDMLIAILRTTTRGEVAIIF